jgi:Family of unknown function (DUF6498)
MFQNLTAQNKRSVFASSLILFVANLLPLIAVWKMNWSFYDLLVLYWTEIILIGAINLFRMFLVTPRESTLGFHLLKIAFVPFFAGHFGLVCVGIGIALMLVFGKENFEVDTQIAAMLFGKSSLVFWPFVISHLFSFFWNYLGQQEFRRTTVMRRMFTPYLRVVAQALFIVGSALVCRHLQSPMYILLALVGGKTLVDLITHVFLHFRFMSREEVRPIITVQD